VKKISRQPLLFALCLAYALPAWPVNEADPALFDMSVEDLLQVQVTSAAKKSQSLNDAAAAIFVISNEDIKRSGATSIPDALRLAPGMDVSKIDANKWAVSARGFNGRFANKLLVLVDGRNAYTRAFSGVYWEMQDVMLEDVERIEIIRGPGGSLWGANAVNGVINIITKHAANTQGGMLGAGAGTEEQGFGALRYGTTLGEDNYARVYFKGLKRDENTRPNGQGAGDGWGKLQGGFRFDSRLTSQDELKVQGDIYQSDLNEQLSMPSPTAPFVSRFNDAVRADGGNVLAKWQRTLSPNSEYSVQAYYDSYHRKEGFVEEWRDTLDLELQHRTAWLDWHDIVWGAGYRYEMDDFGNTLYLQTNPASRNAQLFNLFVQDEMMLVEDRLWLTIGSKLEHNDYSGFEYQPSLRLMWAPDHHHRLWAAMSRAVRTPSRAEQNSALFVTALPGVVISPGFETPPVVVTLQGNPNFVSEELVAYELGYRTTMIDSLSLDMTLFYNDYDRFRSTRLGKLLNHGEYLEQQLTYNNFNHPKTYGYELAAVWQMLDWWRWDASYSYLNTRLDGASNVEINQAPQQRLSLRSALSPLPDVDFDFWLRYVDRSAAINTNGGVGLIDIPAYLTLDLRLAWRPVKDLELACVGQNLLEDRHLEFVQENLTLPTSIDRGVYFKAIWEF